MSGNYSEELGFDTWYLTIIPTGSYFNCDPPVRNTDRDYLVWTPDSLALTLLHAGYLQYGADDTVITQASTPNVPCPPAASMTAKAKASNSIPIDPATGKPTDKFTSWRKGNINLIVTSDTDYWSKHRVAGYICKRLNLLDKEDRIMIYDAVLFGDYTRPEPIFVKKEIDYMSLIKAMCT